MTIIVIKGIVMIPKEMIVVTKYIVKHIKLLVKLEIKDMRLILIVIHETSNFCCKFFIYHQTDLLQCSRSYFHS